jgi:hypothetical protein
VSSPVLRLICCEVAGRGSAVEASRVQRIERADQLSPDLPMVSLAEPPR